MLGESNMLIGKMQRIMDLRSQGYKVDFDFPSIAVIGSQSSGKSSVIESIVGKHLLPRGSNMCTRCPIVLNLYHEPDCQKDWARFSGLNQPRMEDFLEVRNEIERRTESMITGQKCVTDVCIVLNIWSRHYPNNFQLIDLPGFVRVPVADQPEDIKKDIKKLVHKYIEKENTIILAVSDGFVDIAESAGLAEAKKVDPKGLRTVGVLTKLDLLSREKLKDVENTLNNKLVHLKKGHVAVINIPEEEEEEDIDALRWREKDMLKDIGFDRNENCGTQYLMSTLSKELTLKIKEKVPELITRVTEELEDTKNALSLVDKDELKKQPLRKRIKDEVLKYEQSVTKMLEGNDRGILLKEVQGGAKLKELLQNELQDARKEATKLNASEFGKHIEVMLTNQEASHDAILLHSLTLNNCVAVLVEKFKKPFSLLINKFTEQLRTHLRACADETLSPTPALKQKIMEMALEKVSEFRDSCKSDMNKEIDIQKYFINHKHPEFKQYDDLLNGVRPRVQPVPPLPPVRSVEVAQEAAITRDEEFPNPDSELENNDTKNTSGSTWMKWIDVLCCRGRSLSEPEAVIQNPTPTGDEELYDGYADRGNEIYAVPEVGRAVAPTGDTDSDLEMEDTEQTMRSLKEKATAFSSFQEGTREKIITVPTEKKSQKDFVFELVLAYMLILETRVCDSAVKLIMYHLVHTVVEYHKKHDLYEQLFALYEQNPTKVEQYLEIDPQEQEKVDKLKKKLQSCNEVLNVLRDSD